MPYMTKLQAQDVVAIREAYAAGKVTMEQLGERYGVSRQTIGNIVYGRTWQDTPGPIVQAGARPRARAKTLKQRFFAKVEKQPGPDGCWLWTGATASNGYGVIDVNGHTVKAHRLAYRKMVGPIPEGMHVLHHCDAPPCVNPAHLFLGTNADNVADKVAKGRQAKGTDMPQAKLNPAKVKLIRRLHKQGHTHRQIAQLVDVEETAVWLVIQHKTWAHVA